MVKRPRLEARDDAVKRKTGLRTLGVTVVGRAVAERHNGNGAHAFFPETQNFIELGSIEPLNGRGVNAFFSSRSKQKTHRDIRLARGPGVVAARGLGKNPGKVAAALILNGLCPRVRESPVGFFLGKDFLKVGIGDGVLYRKDDRVARFGDTDG